MRFRIFGANEDTGSDVSFLIDAENKADVHARARELGVYVASIELVQSSTPPPLPSAAVGSLKATGPVAASLTLPRIIQFWIVDVACLVMAAVTVKTFENVSVDLSVATAVIVLIASAAFGIIHLLRRRARKQSIRLPLTGLILNSCVLLGVLNSSLEYRSEAEAGRALGMALIEALDPVKMITGSWYWHQPNQFSSDPNLGRTYVLTFYTDHKFQVVMKDPTPVDRALGAVTGMKDMVRGSWIPQQSGSYKLTVEATGSDLSIGGWFPSAGDIWDARITNQRLQIDNAGYYGQSPYRRE